MSEDEKTSPDTSNWKLYQNKEIEFEIKYPANWITVATDANPWDVIGFRESDLKPGDPGFSRIFIKLQSNPNNYNLREYYKNLSETADMYIADYYEIGTPKRFAIEGFEAVQFPVIPGPISSTMTSILLDHGILEIDKHNGYEPADEIYDLMIQTLRISN